MPPARLILLLLLILVAVVLVVVVSRRGSAQRDADRGAAGTLRTEAPRREYEATVGHAEDIDFEVEGSSSAPIDPAEGTGTAEAEAEAETEAEAERAAPAVGVAAVRTSADDRRDGEDTSSDSERIASAADFRDDTPVDPAQEPALDRTEVFPSPDAGSEKGMDVHPSTETEDRSTTAADLPHEADAAMDEPGIDHAPAQAGAAVAETADTDRSAAELAHEPAQERYDPTPARDWAADEGELLEETHDRGERLEAERAELVQQAGGGTGGATASDGTADATASDGTADATASDGTADATASDETADATASDGTADATASGDAGEHPAPVGRRISAFEELRDGGFGVGSAAPLADGAQPLDHPVQAYRDTMTYRVPGDAGYDEAQPHLWFYDEGAAERSGFRHVDG